MTNTFKVLPQKRRLEQSQQVPVQQIVTESVMTQPDHDEDYQIEDSNVQPTEPPNKKHKINLMRKMLFLLLNECEDIE